MRRLLRFCLLPFLLLACLSLLGATRTASAEPTTVRWQPGPVLDQGPREACTGYGLAGWLSAGPDGVSAPPTGSSIWMAARWATGQQGGDGGAVVGVALAWLQRQGYVASWSAAPWRAARTWLLSQGPILIDTTWLTGMDAPAAGGVLTPSGTPRAGHVFYCYAATATGVECRNSWGPHWADHGDFWLSDASVEALFRNYYGTAWLIVKSDAWRDRVKGSHSE